MQYKRLFYRARLVLDEWFTVTVIVLLLGCAVGGWAVATSYADEPAESDRETAADLGPGTPTEPWSTTGSFEHAATVQAENELFDAGTELTDRSLYYTSLTPVLDGEFKFGYTAGEGDVVLEVELDRVLRSVDDETEHWETNETIEQTKLEGVGPDDQQAVPFTVDVAESLNETDRIEESLGQTPDRVETLVVATVVISGTVDGEPITVTERYELEIEPDGDAYTLSGANPEERTQEPVSDEAAVAEASSGGHVGPVALLVGSLLGLATLVVAKRRDVLAPSPGALYRLELVHERERFDDWITAGTLPEGIKNRPTVTVDTLEGIVDVAIDCDSRVIEADDTYAVVDDIVYVYERTVEPAWTGIAPRDSDYVSEIDLECSEEVDYVSGCSTDTEPVSGGTQAK